MLYWQLVTDEKITERDLENICRALKAIAEDNVNRLIVYPVHLNPKVQQPVNRILEASA